MAATFLEPRAIALAVAGAILAIACAGLVYAARLRRARARERELQRLVQERTQQLEEANRRLEDLSFLDGLTEVANRRQFEQILDLEWRRAVRSGSPLSLILADIDHFKAFNDGYGHQAGDRCLRDVATLLDSIVQRAGDQVARYGGEEFAAMLPETDAEGAEKIAERMRRAVESLETGGGRVTVSIGVATTVAGETRSAESLVGAADAALYDAKHAGRNTVRARSL
ncbi:MAG: GGDEF domain-containing protein [Acidobacteriota bacterium]|nr:GGDEF domain-containing protein [Acidobacteriota bacterium]